MFSNQTAQELQGLVDIKTFVGLITARAINSTTKVKSSDMAQTGAYTKRVIKRIDNALNCGLVSAEDYLRMTMGVNQYENRLVMDGLGGCTPISLEQALKEATL